MISMNINSTEEERYEEIKDKELKVVAWDKSKENEISITDSSMSVAKKVKEYYNKNYINCEVFSLDQFPATLQLTNKCLKESLHIMDKIHAESSLMLKLMTVIKPVFDNAVLVEIEKYRHLEKAKANQIKCSYQYLSAFYDAEKIYPVKITSELNKNMYNSNIHMVITIGQIKMKEVLSPRVHPVYAGESVEKGVPSFITINITDLIKSFNRNQGIIIKNLPNKLLNEEQLNFKWEVKLRDAEITDKMLKIKNEMNQLKNEQKQISDNKYNYSDIPVKKSIKQQIKKNNVSIDEH